ncbi:MAG: T9SS type A sorting domain-containing protein [Candidatus Marinimicrobia bacterium]|nr:T9SS type A sorting domain-containing protein [Candidatus Neomarinimicrobiota bacterium]MBL7022683.1 T9SS type A sorting domain-containing protein [Candidatus Neomarinimicrobiota bacterium]MBL7110080.1 T9SS type A sorting domain-containing protein [Candidatus Neomarinimicrobiota bacterium]
MFGLSFLFAEESTIGFFQKVDDQSSVNLIIDSEYDIYGVQFQIRYNPNEIMLDEMSPLIDGFTFEFVEEKKGTINGFIFSLKGIELLSGENTANIVNAKFSGIDSFTGVSLVSFTETIIAGQHGEGLETEITTPSFEINIPVTYQTDLFSDFRTELYQNYPNPFDYSTQIDYTISTSGMVKITILDDDGNEVTTLVDDFIDKGSYSVVWDGIDQYGRTMPNGMYFLKMKTDDFEKMRIMTLYRQ